MKKVFSILLICLSIILIFTGCANKELTYTGKYAEAYEKYRPNKVVMKVGDSKVTWQEYFYWSVTTVEKIESYESVDCITDWDEQLTDLYTTREYVRNYSDGVLQQYHAVMNKAEELGLEWTDEDEANLLQILESMKSSYDTEDEYKEALRSMYMTEDFLKDFYKMYLVTNKCMEYVCGVNFSNISEEDMDTFIADNNLYFAKHILVSTVGDDGNELEGEDLQAKYAIAEGLLNQLRESDDPLALFDELMNTYSEDAGVVSNPDGYCYVDGQMITEFNETVKELSENEISGIVKSAYGYHIILRLPANYDLVPTRSSSGYTIREEVGNDQFAAVLDAWVEESEITYTKFYEKMDFAEIFVPSVAEETTTEAEQEIQS